MREINKIILHHRGGNGGLQSLKDYHLSIGYKDVGYHFYIRHSGEVCKGRLLSEEGANCYGHNKDSIGICLEGDFTKTKPTKKQLEAMNELVHKMMNVFSLSKEDVYNHRDLYNTLCPAYDLKNEVTNIKHEGAFKYE